MVVDLDGRPVATGERPSAETVLHTRLYRRDAEIGCVLHTLRWSRPWPPECSPRAGACGSRATSWPRRSPGPRPTRPLRAIPPCPSGIFSEPVLSSG